MAWAYIGAGLRIVAQFAIQVTLARVLGPVSFGQASTVLVVMGIGWLLADGGFGSALIQKADLHEDDIAYALAWILVSSILVGAVVFAGAGLLARLLDDPGLVPLVRVCAVLIPLQAFSNVPASLLRRELDMRRQQLLYVGTYVAGMGAVGVTLAYNGFGAWALVVGYGVQLALALVVGCFMKPFALRLRFAHHDRAFRNFGLSVLGTNIANWCIENLDRLLIGRFWGIQKLGEYSAAGNLARAPATVVVGTLQSVVFSSTARAQDDPDSVRRGFRAILSLLTLISAPFFFFVALQSTFVIHLLYGDKWSGAATLFAAMCVGIPAYAVLSIAGPMLWGLGAARAEFSVQLVIAIATVTGLVLCSRLALDVAVWLIPALAFLRALLVVRALLPRIGLTAGTAFGSCRGGLALAIVVLLVSLPMRVQFGQGLCAVLGSAGLTLLACLVVARLTNGNLLDSELRQSLQERAVNAPWARRACALLGFRAVREARA